MFVDSFLGGFGGTTGLHKTKKALAFSPRRKRPKTTTGDDPRGEKRLSLQSAFKIERFT